MVVILWEHLHVAILQHLSPFGEQSVPGLCFLWFEEIDGQTPKHTAACVQVTTRGQHLDVSAGPHCPVETHRKTVDLLNCEL